jgi:hypothetical protein
MEEIKIDRKELINRLFAVRAEISQIEAGRLKDLKAVKLTIENNLKAELEVGEAAKFAGIGTVSMKEEIQPVVTDWDALYAYVKETDAFYLFQRKVNGAPFRDALAAGISIPGLEPVTVRKLNVRADSVASKAA